MENLQTRRFGGARPWIALSAVLAMALHFTSALAQQACKSQGGAVSVSDFGAKGDGASDNMKAFKDAIAYAAKCSVPVVHIPAGKYVFVPHGPSAGIQLPSNIALTGEGMSNTVLQVAGGVPGANFDSLFWARNQDHVEFRDIGFFGNSTVVNNPQGHPLNTYGSAISITIDKEPGTPANGTPKNLSHFLVANCNFENFNGAAWIRVINYSDGYSIDDITVSDSRFVSHEGNAVNPTEISYPSHVMSFMGSTSSKTGLVTNVRITNNVINATHIKGGIAVWCGVRSVQIVNNTIGDAGADPAIPYDRGAYAILVYDNSYYHDSAHPEGARHGGSRPDDIHIERNQIVRPKSCGIYIASARQVWIIGNKISGQSDPQNQTLAKGAIVAGYALDATVKDNEISNSHIGMTLLGGERFRIAESNNSITGVPPGGIRVVQPRIQPPEILSRWAAEDE